jgi:hypothetical protein
VVSHMSWASDAPYGSKGRGKGCFWKSLARPFDAVCRVLYNYCRPDERLSLIGLLIHVSLMQHSYKYHTFIFRFLNQEYDTVPPSIMAARFHQDPELCSCSGTCSSLPPRHHMNPEKSAAIRSPRKLRKRGAVSTMVAAHKLIGSSGRTTCMNLVRQPVRPASKFWRREALVLTV